MVGVRRRDENAHRAALTAYVVPDTLLRALEHGVGELRVDGVLEGHLASVVGSIRFPHEQPWPWFVIVWLDGTKENSFEDYGPHWPTVRDLAEGRFEHFGPSLRTERKFFGTSVVTSRLGEPRLFDFELLPAEIAAKLWLELDLVDSDF